MHDLEHPGFITKMRSQWARSLLMIGLVIDIGGVSFDFLMDPLGVNTLRQGETKLYRPAHLMFEGRGRAHVIFLCWSSDHSEDGVVFTRNLNAEAAARLRSKLRRSKRQ